MSAILLCFYASGPSFAEIVSIKGLQGLDETRYHHFESTTLERDYDILVGTSYGTEDFERGNKRVHDYPTPLAERDHYGGAQNFQEFLRDELLPFIEGKYRSSAERRVIFGQSPRAVSSLFTRRTRSLVCSAGT